MNIHELHKAARSSAFRPDPTLSETIRSYHQELRQSTRKITSLRNDRLAEKGFDTKPVEQEAARIANVVTVQVEHALPLYRLVRALRPQQVVEIGTGARTSGAMMAAALRDNGSGSLLTLDGAPDMVELSRGLFARLGLSDRIEQLVGLFNDTVPLIPQRLSAVQFAFVDDEHRAESSERDMQALVPLMPDGGIIVFDDINWAGAQEAWLEAARRPDCAFSCTLDYRGLARFGLWCKGSPQPGYRGRPAPLEYSSLDRLGPAFRIARRALGKRV